MAHTMSHAAPPPLAATLAREGVVTFMVSLILFGPLTGLVLSGYDFDSQLWRPIIIASIVTAGRLVMTCLYRAPSLQGLWQTLAAASGHGVTVKTGRERSPFLALAALFVLGASLPLWLDKYWLGVAILALIYVLLGLGLNIVVGLAGLLDLGFVAFYAVGAYLLALGAQYFGLGFWSALALAPLIAAFFGMVLAFPVLRMHGDYLAIVTLGFGEIIRLVLTNWADVTGGPDGVQVPSPTVLGLEFGRRAREGGVPLHEFLGIPYNPDYKFWFLYGVLFLVVCAVIYFVERLRVIPLGRMWEALREDEIACRSLGINHVSIKLAAFMLGASTGGIAGVFFAAQQGFVNPTSFTFIESALILAIVVLGGLGSTLGVIIAAIVLTLLPEVLRDFAEFRMLIFGILMVVMMLWRPRGLVRIRRSAFKRPDQTGDAP